jgi:hypothetical protein
VGEISAILAGALLIAGAIAWGASQIVSEMRAARGGAGSSDRLATLLSMFAPGLAAAQQDPRAFLVWQPLAQAARQLYPDEFATLDRAVGGTFPFTRERIEAAHSQWTADWLAWEHAHDADYKMKVAVAEHEVSTLGGTTVARTRLEAVEREKLEGYQRRYADYVRIAKALQALSGS